MRLMPIRILVVDDHQMVREGLISLLAKEHDLIVVAEAESGESAMRLCRETVPDILVLDLTLPDISGIEVARTLRSDCPSVRILILSMHSDRRFVTEAVTVGASGYILKDAASNELIRAIRTIASGETFFSPTVAGIIVTSYIESRQQSQSATLQPLSPRETEVLRLLAQGQNTKEIAHTLSISSKTVETFRANIMRKLNIFSVAELTRYAIRTGITSL